ncbi:hypothetical protein P376_5124 [Streptomyces sp. HCCB10043]|nr:hypothetical protein P376_5124 [Streptomyces sp. HCCB10043]
MVTGFEGDVGGAATGPVVGRAQGVDLGVRSSGALMEAFTGHGSGGVGDHTSDDRIGAGGAETTGGERDRSAHRGDVGCGVHRVLLPLRARTPGPVDDDRESGKPARTPRTRGRETPGTHGIPGDSRPCVRRRRRTDDKPPRTASHPDFNRRSRNFTWSTGRWLRTGRGL